MRSIFKLLGLALTWVMIATCNKPENQEPLGAGILLTTDVPPHNWYDVRDLLKANNAKITFYIQSYHTLDSSNKAMMKVMMTEGHEMAHHTTTHPHADEYLLSHTIDEYMQKEVFDMDSLMAIDGIYTQTFAYPFGDFTDQSDAFLLKRFKSIRKIISPFGYKNLQDVDQIYYRFKGARVFYGCTIDQKLGLKLKEIIDALDKAKSSRQTISLYCHFINNGTTPETADQYSVDYETLKAILDYANKIGLRFYTAKEISR